MYKGNDKDLEDQDKVIESGLKIFSDRPEALDYAAVTSGILLRAMSAHVDGPEHHILDALSSAGLTYGAVGLVTRHTEGLGEGILTGATLGIGANDIKYNLDAYRHAIAGTKHNDWWSGVTGAVGNFGNVPEILWHSFADSKIPGIVAENIINFASPADQAENILAGGINLNRNTPGVSWG